MLKARSLKFSAFKFKDSSNINEVIRAVLNSLFFLPKKCENLIANKVPNIKKLKWAH